jgi:ferritin-like protein
MTDGNTYAINKHLNDQEDWDALQEVTAELEQAEARIEELEGKLAKALEFIQDLTGCEWPYCEDAKRILAELKGKTDE